jgi:serine/threonine protein phosphatase PrpC
MSTAPGSGLVTGPSWQLFGHSQIGSAHIRRGAINQDYVGWCCDSNGLWFAAAVADGHGAPAYFRSDIGAKFAVQAALDCLGLADHQSPDAALLGQQIQSRWRELVGSHVAQNPYPLRPDGGELLPYGSTLIAAGASARWLVTAQIGDGDAYIGFSGQTLHRIDASQDAFEGEQTLSLCMPDAASQFTISIIDLDWVERAPDFLVLCTDGVAKSFPNAPACLQAMNQVRQLCISPTNQFASMAREIPTWLSEVSQRGSGDDASMLIAMRRTLADVW